MAHRNRRPLLVSALLFAAVAAVRGQGGSGPVLPILLRANEHLGKRLLAQLHEATPDRNVVVSPISLSLILGAVSDASVSAATHDEISTAFGVRYISSYSLAIASRMLLTVFEKPAVPPGTGFGTGTTARPLGAPPAAWIDNAFLYRGKDTLSARFMDRAEKYFGITFTGDAPVQALLDASGARTSGGSLTATQSQIDFVLKSAVHLNTQWSGNTFLAKPHQADFTTAAGTPKTVDMLTSETARYRHARTDRFEAVALQGNRASLIAVLPAAGQDIVAFERELIASPDTIEPALTEQVGTITMPPFHFRVETDLRSRLEAMGMTRVFADLDGMVKIERSHFTQVRQAVDIQVDAYGIRADAEMSMAGIYGGVSIAREVFDMKLDRPFVFMVRDSLTDVLLFIGAVVDPTLK